jgi:hypothetical protein
MERRFSGSSTKEDMIASDDIGFRAVSSAIQSSALPLIAQILWFGRNAIDFTSVRTGAEMISFFLFAALWIFATA